ncbi:hypothetical protein SD70_20480 [Gordoniibacillus kamchatkensis]|uniref:Uncharacterized protein n=1 Tax=Gordoniibacillus kamchatkensis TaxID=1590651 RepID=A0ABR5AF24_9BACL|nr:hypothetical protein [Paenibacillus sp. VKM B-2647]KIL39428.1 hypothetical protein SD70_20480 [Paenibacillus sp. VKM B-2647]
MTNLSSSLSGDSTIYNYKLLMKIRHSYPLVTVYWLALAMFAFVLSLHGGWLWLLVAAPLTVALQGVITRLCLWMMRGGTASVWGWRFGALWNGVLPVGFAPLPLTRRIQSNVLLAGLAAIGALYPWLSGTALDSLLFFHLWLLAPRCLMIALFRRKTKSGWIKINPHDTGCYVQ